MRFCSSLIMTFPLSAENRGMVQALIVGVDIRNALFSHKNQFLVELVVSLEKIAPKARTFFGTTKSDLKNTVHNLPFYFAFF